MAAWLSSFRSWLVQPVDGRVIGLFRLIFGLFMAWYALYYYRIGFIPQGLLQPKVLFRYDYLEWIPTFPAPAMYLILALMGLSGLLIAAGLFFRWACWMFSFCLAFFLFQEKSYYNNHIYLFILLPLLLSATDADRFFSLRKKIPHSAFRIPHLAVPRWQQFILQLQILIVYFFAGVVKWKADWLLRMEPMQSMIGQFPEKHWMAPLLKHDFNIYLFTYGGFLLDILSPLLLLYKPVRNWAWIPFALFHLANSQIFDDISIFPFVMLGSMLLFFETREIPVLRNLAQPMQASSKRKAQPAAAPAAMVATAPWTARLLTGYFVFQLLFPLRGFLLPNPLDYTTIGNRFAWRVKADTRQPHEMRFTVEHAASGQSSQVDIGT
ncbi:MAG: HTTM domain-containing protein, partial [Saprospiraceae bacterium]|nr:HTTM domain-containing protein [Saprospiraceae bacterium]